MTAGAHPSCFLGKNEPGGLEHREVQHLAVLETSGLVLSEKAGRVRTCRINPAALAEAERWIADRRMEWERRLDRLGEYLNTLKNEGESHDKDR